MVLVPGQLCLWVGWSLALHFGQHKQLVCDLRYNRLEVLLLLPFFNAELGRNDNFLYLKDLLF